MTNVISVTRGFGDIEILASSHRSGFNDKEKMAVVVILKANGTTRSWRVFGSALLALLLVMVIAIPSVTLDLIELYRVPWRCRTRPSDLRNLTTVPILIR